MNYKKNLNIDKHFFTMLIQKSSKHKQTTRLNNFFTKNKYLLSYY